MYRNVYPRLCEKLLNIKLHVGMAKIVYRELTTDVKLLFLLVGIAERPENLHDYPYLREVAVKVQVEVI